MKSELRVICETCGAGRGKRCRSVKRPPGMPRGMLPMWQDREPVPTHRERKVRAKLYAAKRWKVAGSP